MSLERNLEKSVLIVGAGPSGSAAGAMLAKAGIDVQIVDKTDFPRDKICGDGISPLSLECLRELGIDLGELDRKYDRQTFVGLVSPGGKRWRAKYEGSPDDPNSLDYGHVIPRMDFDKMILDHAVKAGARFAPGWSFESLEVEREFVKSVTLKNADGERVVVKPKILLCADGEHSLMRKALTGGEKREHVTLAVRGHVDGLKNLGQDMEFHFTKEVAPGYGWIFPEGAKDRANIGVYIHTSTLKKSGISMKEHYARFLERTGGPGQILEGANPCGPVQGYPITYYDPARRVHFGNALLLGDAAGLADPLTGEGIFEALYSGLAAAHAAQECLAAGEQGSLASYMGSLARMYLPLRRRGFFIMTLLDKMPYLADWIFTRCAADPKLSERLFLVVTGNGSAWNFFSPAVWARIYFPFLYPRAKELPA
ncbi:MAG: geranylgeranyl reductase family protein [Chrysiogenetes bacterium]|nr:geranylgeranyl reductase family protein [Chrysiogenetes bacterium]